MYICQHILTHLGDIARYANLFQQAKNYYMHAIKLVPYLGHPYNQLGILFETSRTNQLCTIFYYVRSVAVRYNFPLASTNMENFFKKLVDIPLTRYNSSLNNPDSINNLLNNNEPHLNLVVKLSHKDLITLYLQINALIYYLAKSVNSLSSGSSGGGTNSSRISSYMELFKTSFVAFMQTPLQRDKLDEVQLTQMVAILIYLISSSASPGIVIDEATNPANDLKLLAHCTAVNMLVYFIEQLVCLLNEAISLEELLLPSIYLAVSFLEHFNDSYLISDNKLWLLNKKTSSQTYQFCDSTVKMLNTLHVQTNDSASVNLENKYKDYPILEERMLDSFLPFKETQKHLNFAKYMRNRSQVLDEKNEMCLRKRRILFCFERMMAKKENCYLELDDKGDALFKVKLEMPATSHQSESVESPNVSMQTLNDSMQKSDAETAKQVKQQQQPAPRKRRQIVAIHSLTQNKLQQEQLDMAKAVSETNKSLNELEIKERLPTKPQPVNPSLNPATNTLIGKLKK